MQLLSKRCTQEIAVKDASYSFFKQKQIIEKEQCDIQYIEKGEKKA
jgi:hypothetical protein